MPARTLNPWLKILLELGPVIAFFVAYRYAQGETDTDKVVFATLVFVPLVLVALGVSWRLSGSLPRMAALTAVVVVVFGGLTVALNDATFVKLKPTVIYLLFAGVLGAGLLRGRSWLQYLMGEMMPLTARGWMIFTRRFALYFVLLAVVNEAVWRTQTTDFWVSFKTFFLPAATFLFILSQMPMLNRHMAKEPVEKGKDSPS